METMSQIKDAFELGVDVAGGEDPEVLNGKAKVRARVRRYMGLARYIADNFSKDPSTKVACLVIGADPKKIAFGYNGFPQGIADSDDRLNDKEIKYRLIQHAERNALDNAEFDLRGGVIVSTLYPCVECAKSIISRGIRTVVTTPSPIREPWKQSSEWAAELFKEAGVEVVIVEEIKTASSVADGTGRNVSRYFKSGGA